MSQALIKPLQCAEITRSYRSLHLSVEYGGPLVQVARCLQRPAGAPVPHDQKRAPGSGLAEPPAEPDAGADGLVVADRLQAAPTGIPRLVEQERPQAERRGKQPVSCRREAGREDGRVQSAERIPLTCRGGRADHHYRVRLAGQQLRHRPGAGRPELRDDGGPAGHRRVQQRSGRAQGRARKHPHVLVGKVAYTAKPAL
jgi:hypothetical protein